MGPNAMNGFRLPREKHEVQDEDDDEVEDGSIFAVSAAVAATLSSSSGACVKPSHPRRSVEFSASHVTSSTQEPMATPTVGKGQERVAPRAGEDTREISCLSRRDIHGVRGSAFSRCIIYRKTK